VRAVLEHVVGPEAAAGVLVLAGDVVPHKKPAPDVYLLALDRLGLRACEAVVIEDSGNGLDAAHAAGIRCVVTVNDYTRDDDFGTAALVVSSLGDPAGEGTQVLADASGVPVGDWVTLATLEALVC
jgi:beta-phosphoglucomutase-like phosphatase (HAD superfamily)